MGLETRLAEVEVLAGDLGRRAYDVDYEKQVMLGNRLGELSADLQNLGEAYHKAKKLLKGKKKGLAAGSLGDVMKRQKNLADNLNRIMQMVYSGKKYLSYSDDNVDLRDLEKNTASAPLLEGGQSMYDLFVSFHGPRNFVSQTRNGDAHGNTMQTIWETSKRDRELDGVKERYQLDVDGKSIGAREWMETEMEKYLTGAKTILDRISQEGPEIFASSRRDGSVLMKRLRNFGNRHKAGVALAGASAVLAGGLVGGVLLDDIVQARRDKRVAERNAESSQQMAEAYEILGITSDAMRFSSEVVNGLKDSVDEMWQPHVIAHAILRDRHKEEPDVLEKLGDNVDEFLEHYNVPGMADSLSEEFHWVSMSQRYGIPLEDFRP